MKKCPVCNKREIQNQYEMCVWCLKEVGKLNKEQTDNSQVGQLQILKNIQQSLEHANWNLGYIQKYLKFFLIMDLEKEGFLSESRRQIYDLLKKDFGKDLKVIEDIKKEQEK